MWCEGLTFKEWFELHNCDRNILKYLYGWCNVWLNDHYRNGDSCLAIIEEGDCLVHCCLLRNEKFIDIRGETSDFNKVMEGLEYDEFKIVRFESLEKFNEQYEPIIHLIGGSYDKICKTNCRRN